MFAISGEDQEFRLNTEPVPLLGDTANVRAVRWVDGDYRCHWSPDSEVAPGAGLSK